MGVDPAIIGASGALASTLSFAPDRNDDGTALTLIQTWLELLPLEPARRRDVLVVASELLTNARHYGAAGSVRVDCRSSGGRLAVAVRNGEVGSRVPPRRAWVMPEPMAVRGRGLAIVARLADAVDVRRGRGAVEVAATFRWSVPAQSREPDSRSDGGSVTAF